MARKKNRKPKTRPVSQRQSVSEQVNQVPSVPTGGEVSDGPLLLTMAGLSQLLNLSRSTLYRMAKAGNLPGRVVVGSRVRYHRPTIEAWLCSLVKGGGANDAV